MEDRFSEGVVGVQGATPLQRKLYYFKSSFFCLVFVKNCGSNKPEPTRPMAQSPGRDEPETAPLFHLIPRKEAPL